MYANIKTNKIIDHWCKTDEKKVKYEVMVHYKQKKENHEAAVLEDKR